METKFRNDRMLYIPGSVLKRLVQDEINRGAPIDRESAIIDLMIDMHEEDVKSHRYYAKRWKWKDHTTYKRMKVMRLDIAERLNQGLPND